MKQYVALAILSLVLFGCDDPYSESAILSTKDLWPPISDYEDMAAYELGNEIGLIRMELADYKQSDNPRDRALVVEARNRLNVLLLLYAEKSGRSLESVIEMYGD